MKLKTKRLIIAGILIIIAPMTLIHSIKEYSNVSNVNDWPHVKGFILFSGVQENKEHNRNSSKNTFSPRYTMSYTHKLEYSYEVNGADYTGNNLNFSMSNAKGSTFVNKEDAIAHAKNFPKGKAVDVFYNPEKPIISSLSNKSASIRNILFAILFVLFAILALLIATEKINPQNLPWRKSK